MNFSNKNFTYQRYDNPYLNEMRMNMDNLYSKKNYQNSNNSVSTDLRIISLENRVETLEKMLKYLDEFIHLKEEEKNNDFQISNNESINILNSQVQNLQKKIDDSKIEEIGKKIEIINNTLGIQNISGINNNKRQNKNFNNFSSNLTFMKEKEKIINEKINEFNNIIKNNDLVIDGLIKEKLSSNNIQIENKLNNILNVIEDLNKITEENEYSINEIKENFRKIQQDNIDVIKEMSIQTEKYNQIDFLIEQISQLKEKYGKLLNIFESNENEEDKFIKQYLSSKH
jgi:hypothetical protein